jgi:DNA-binding MarR family transcriptional regulator
MNVSDRRMNEIYGMPGHLFRRNWQITTSLFTEECSEFDLTSVQYAAMVAIAANPGVDATRLSTLIAFDRSTLGSVLERLEAKKWIKRSASDKDKRTKICNLTSLGLHIVQAAEARVKRVQKRLLTPLNESEQRLLVQLMQRIIQQFETSGLPIEKGRDK